MSSRGANKSRGLLQWPSIVLAWANLFEEEKSSGISALRHSTCIQETIKSIYKFNGSEDISFKNNEDLVLKFIREYYPEIIKEKRFNIKKEDDILVLMSLLMYTTCMKCKIEEYVEKTCLIKLDDNHQEFMKRFFESMLTFEAGTFTRKNIMDTVQLCFETEETTESARKSLSPSAQRNCLKEFLGSPGTQGKYEKIKEESDVKHFNKLLQEENLQLLTDKETLTEKNRELEASMKKLQTQLNEKMKEINALREDLLQNSLGGPENDLYVEMEKKLNKEINELKKELNDMHQANDLLIQENEKHLKKNRSLEADLHERNEDLAKKVKSISEMEVKLEDSENRILTLESTVQELRQIIEQYEETKTPRVEEELNMSAPRVEENLGAVFHELELKEKQEQITQLQEQVKCLELVCEEKDFKYNTVEKILIENDITIKNLRKEVKQQSISVTIMNQSCIELNEKLKEAKAKNNEHFKLLEENIDVEKSKNTELVQKIKWHEMTENRLQEELQTKSLDVEKLQNELQSKCLEVESLQMEYESKCKAIEKLNYNLQLKCLEIEKLQDTLQKKDSDFEKLQVELQSQFLDIEKLQNELQSKGLEIEGFNTVFNNFCNQIKANEEEIESLRNQTKDLNTNNRILEERFMKYFSEYNQLTENIRECRNIIDQRETTIADKQKEICQLNSVIQTLSQERKDLLSKNSTQAEQIRHHETSEKRLREELQSKCIALENATKTVNDLRNQLKASDSEMKTLTNQVKKLKTKIETVVNNLTASLAENRELEEQLSNSVKKIAQLNTTIADKEYQIDQMKVLIQTLSEEEKEYLLKNAYQEGEIKQLEISKKDLETKLEAKCSEIEELNRTLSALQIEVDNFSACSVTLRDELSLASSKIQALEDQLYQSNEKFKQDIADKDTQLIHLQDINNNLEVEKKEVMLQLQDQLDEMKQMETRQKDLESQLQSKCSECEELNRSLASSHQQIGDLSATVAALEEKLSLASARTEEVEKQLNDSIEKFEQEIAEKDSQVRQLQEVERKLEMVNKDIMTQLQDQLDETNQIKTRQKDLESQLQSKCSDCEELNRSLASSHQQIGDLSATVAALEQKLSLASARTEEAEKQLSDSNERFEHEIAEKDSLVNQLREVKSKLEMDNEENMTQLQDQLNEIKQLETRQKDLESQLQSKCSECEELNRSLASSHQQIGDLSATVAALEEKLSLASAKIEEVEKQFSDSIEKFEQEIAEKDSQVRRLQEVESKLEIENKDINTQLKEQHDEMKQMETRQKDLESQLQSKCSECEELNRSLANSLQQIGALSATVAALEEKLSLASARTEDLEKQLIDSNERFEQELAEKDSLVKQLQEAESKLELENKDIMTQLQDQLVEMKQMETRQKDLESQLQSKCSECEELNRALASSHQQIGDLSATVAALEEKLSLASAKIEVVEKQLSDSNKKFEQEIAEKDSLVKQLQEIESKLEMENKQVTIQLQNQLDEMKQMETRQKDLESQLQSKCSECEELNRSLANSHQQIGDLSATVAALEQKLFLASARTEEVEKQLSDLNGKFEREIAEKDSQVKQLQEELSLQQQLENRDPQLREAYDKLFDDYHRLNSEHDELKTELGNVKQNVRAEYEKILDNMKAHMRASVQRVLEQKEEKHLKEMRNLQDTVKSNQDHINRLSTNLWDTCDKLLITKNKKEELEKEVMDLKRKLKIYQSEPDNLHRTRSHDQIGAHSLAGPQVKEEEVALSRRQSVRTVPSGIGKVFPSEDEAGEVFNNECLADLKAGRCQVAADPDRMSTLMYRNSLCPPHLKSSYPAETQFLPADILHEDDIKGRGTNDDAKLLPDKRRKDRSQTSYKKPGPPTPSKNGRRLSQVMEVKSVASSPRTALREVNNENKQPATPSRLFSNIFSSRQRRNQNETPERRRLSFFGKPIKKEPTG